MIIYLALFLASVLFTPLFGKGSTTLLLSDKDLPEVQEHYMNYPYPHVDPSERISRTFPPVKGPRLEDINHYFYGGRGDLGRTKVFRILVAGGGTGSSLIHYASMFRSLKAEIVYLDFSHKSLEIAKQRIHEYGLKGVVFERESIFNIPKLNLGKFDFIDCYGVLHHLSDPEEGLRILKESLSPSGGMFLMLYEVYGRQSLYSLQGTLRIAGGNANLSYAQEVKNGRYIYSNLLPNNWAGISGSRGEASVDEGFYDMYLHKRDVAYTVPELYEYIETKGGLHIVDYFDPLIRDILSTKHKICEGLSKERLYALNAMIYGLQAKHDILVSRQRNTTASLDDWDNVPFFVVKSIALIMEGLTKENIKDKRIRIQMKVFRSFKNSFSVPVSKYTGQFIKIVLHRKYSIREILGNVWSQRKVSADEAAKERIARDFKKTFKALIHHGLLLLRHKTLPDIPSNLYMNDINEVS